MHFGQNETTDKIALREHVRKKQEEYAAYANNRRRPSFECRFQVGDFVRPGNGPIRKLIKKIGPFTFLTNNNFTVNTRNLRLHHRPKVEYVTIPKDAQPLNHPVVRYGHYQTY